MRSTRLLAVALLTATLAAACGSDNGNGSADGSAVTTATTATTTTADDTTTTGGGDTTTTAGDTTTTTTDDDTTTTAVTLEQPAIWPAPGVVFDTPEAAAEDFVTEVLQVPANLGEFMQGDARSGEMDVLFGGENGDREISRSLLLLRQLGPDNGWFVLAAVNPNASVTSPESGATVDAGSVTVEGLGRGFEGAVTVSAYPAGDSLPLDQVATQGGSMADPAPFTETLDLSGAEPGTTVMLLVRGGVGLETDPGDFGAIPVVISG